MKLPFRCNHFDYTAILTFLLSGAFVLGIPAGESPFPSGPADPRTVISRRLIASRTDDGFWSANARLPTAFQSGGSDKSRTKMDLTTKTTAGRDADSSDNGGKFGGQPRHHRRLTKWEKTRDDDALEGGSEVLSSDQDEGSLLYQSLKAMETHLLEKPEDEMLDNSSEKDVYLQDGSATGMGGGGSAAEQDSDEDDDANEEDGEEEKSNFMMEGNMGGGAQNDMTKEKSDVHMNAIKLQQLKQTHNHHHHNHQQQTTTPKGLTTWSAVGSGGVAQQPIKGTVQKVSMADFTVSSPVGFSTQSTNKPITTANIITKDKMTEMPTTMTMAPTTTTTSAPMTTMTMPPVTVQTSNIVVPTKPKRRPAQNTKKPTKYVRPALDEVTATQIGSDETHNVYVLKPVQETESKTATPDLMATYTKQPWPFMTTKKAPFSKIRTTARPIKNAYAKRTQTPKLTLTTPMTTTKPSTSTVYYRRPAGGFVHPVIPVSFSNLSFMDYIRTQIVPKIGLSMISFIATSPLILTMLGAVGRKKRDLSEVTGKSAAAAQDWKFAEDLETMASKWEYQMKSSTPSSMLNGYDDHKKPNKRNKIRSKKNPY